MTTAVEAAPTTENDVLGTIQEAVGTAVAYVGEAGAAAGSTVRSAAGKTGQLVGAGAYKGAYGVSYGLVFGAVFLKELLPIGNALRTGFEDGADAAFTAVETRKARGESAEAEPKKARARKPAKDAA